MDELTFFIHLSFRSVADVVYTIRDQVCKLRQQNKEVLKMLEEEISARQKLEALVKTKLGGNQ